MTVNSPTTRSLSEWVEYVQTLHSREIELSLERVRSVYLRLYPDGFKPKVISIAGTNGKGSCAELISSIYASAGYKVGKFTSPHLIDFSERYVINGQQVSEVALLKAFEKIEQIRTDIGITFFEFGALLAIELFANAKVDIAVMEVGLGGRLDAINILDADLAVITSISKDHTAWLGDTVEKIGYEKVGIARAGNPCVVGIEQPPQSILDHCENIGAQVHYIGRDFSYTHNESGSNDWQWQSSRSVVKQLPRPFDQTDVQLSNASVCLHAISLLEESLPVSEKALRAGLQRATLLARCQILSVEPLIILDVAHNQRSVERLRDFILKQNVKGRVFGICGMLKDKEVRDSLAVLVDVVDRWHLATIDHARGASSGYMQTQLREALMKLSLSQGDIRGLNIDCYDNVIKAFETVEQRLEVDDCLVVFGSFFVAGDILQFVKTDRSIVRQMT